MADHEWVLEHIASYCAGGLDTGECQELAAHVADCPECAKSLEETRQLNQTLDELFATARPRPGLEDRMIHELRNARPIFKLNFYVRVALSAAALLFLGIVGAVASVAVDRNALRFPGEARKSASHGESEAIFGWFSEARTAAPMAGFEYGGSGSQGRWVHAYTEETSVSPNSVSDIELEAKGKDPGRPILDADQLARQAANRSLTLKGTKKHDPFDQNLANDEIGNAPRSRASLGDKPSNYNVDRIEERSVPGPVNPNERAGMAGEQTKTSSASLATAAVPPGFGGGGGMDGRSGSRREGMLTGKDAAGKDGEGKGYYTYRDDRTASKVMPMGGANGSNGGIAMIVGAPAPLLPSEAKPAAPPVAEPAQPAKEEVAQGPVGQQPKIEEPAPVTQRKIIREGNIEFEVDSFDNAVDKIAKIATEEKGFVATVNSEKLPNGKVRGSVVVRTVPERLDTLILKLRALGDLKSQRIGTREITKEYYDLESRLRAARTMENRLIEIIKTGKGEIKELLAAEKELGIWRTRIEEIEGELRYFNNLVSLSTLTITLQERDVRSPFALTETELVDLGIEVEDVEKAQKDAHQAINEAKGRITKSELKQHSAGQFQAIIHCEASPESAGPLRDRLKQLGEVTRLDVNRSQKSEGPSGKPQDLKVTRNDVVFHVSLFNVVNIPPRETVQLSLACTDAEAAYKIILDRVQKASGRIATHKLDRQRNDQTTGSITFDVKSDVADAVLTDIKANGEIMRLQVNENPDQQGTTKSKRGFIVQLWALGAVAPREMTKITIAARDVPKGYRTLQDAILGAKGRVLNAQLNEKDRQNIWATLHFDVRRSELAAVITALGSVGDVLTSEAVRSQDTETTIDNKVGLELTIINAINISPRETITVALEVGDVEKVAEAVKALLASNKGRELEDRIVHQRTGQVISKQVYDVPLSAYPALMDKIKGVGIVRVQEAARDRQAPEGSLAIARLDITMSNQSPIMPSDGGVWTSARTGLETGLKLLTMSLTWVLVGVLFVLPWAVVGYGGWRLLQRLNGKKEEMAVPPTVTPAT